MTRNARALLPLLLLSALGLTAACAPLLSASDPGNAQSSSTIEAGAPIGVSDKDFALDDAVLAIQLSGRVAPLYGEGTKGYLALVNEKGEARVSETGIMEYATPPVDRGRPVLRHARSRGVRRRLGTPSRRTTPPVP